MGQEVKVRRFKNIIGRQVSFARKKQGMTQYQLAAKLQIAGFSVDNIGVSKIEHQIRSVNDYEVQIIADILNVPVETLFPHIQETKASLNRLHQGFRKELR